MLRRTSPGGALRALDFDGQARARLGRPLLCALGIPGGIHRAAAAGNSHLHRTAGGSGSPAPRAGLHLHIFLVLALGVWAWGSWDEAWGEPGRAWGGLSPIPCGG